MICVIKEEVSVSPRNSPRAHDWEPRNKYPRIVGRELSPFSVSEYFPSDTRRLRSEVVGCRYIRLIYEIPAKEQWIKKRCAITHEFMTDPILKTILTAVVRSSCFDARERNYLGHIIFTIQTMKQHRSRQGLTLRFDQRDHLPTIIEGQSLDTHTPKLLKIPWYMESNKGDVCSLLLEEPQVTRHTGDAKEPRVRDFAPDIVSSTRFSASDCPLVTMLIVKTQIVILYQTRLI